MVRLFANDPGQALDDVTFERRNREYGAYQLRKSATSRLQISYLLAILIFMGIVLLFDWVPDLRPVVSFGSSGNSMKLTEVHLSANPLNLELASSHPATSVEEIPTEFTEEAVTNETIDNKANSGTGDTSQVERNGIPANVAGNGESSGEGIEGEVLGSADVNPQFPGGEKAMQDFIKSNMNYPKQLSATLTKGSIWIYVVITKDGFLRDVKVLKSVDPVLDAEAVRVVKSMPRWKPAMKGNVPVNVKCVIPIKVSPL